jgi:hypothetical protein
MSDLCSNTLLEKTITSLSYMYQLMTSEYFKNYKYPTAVKLSIGLEIAIKLAMLNYLSLGI